MSREMLNIGCGRRLHDDWLNVDLNPADARVAYCDIRRPLPFASNRFAAVYHSHVLEHLDPGEASRLIAQCARVLRPGGVLRIVVPDLENIVRAYLAALEQVDAGRPEAEQRHAWMVTELIDQMSRTRPGGQMGEQLRDLEHQSPGLRRFIRERLGDEVDLAATDGSNGTLISRLRQAGIGGIFRFVRRRITRIVVRCIGGKSLGEAFDEIQVRIDGEVHRWMYDRASLRRLLIAAGLRDVQVCRATESRIPDFHRYELDTGPDGRAHKPDSLYMEAVKPA